MPSPDEKPRPQRPRTAAVFGAGIAGLSAAHELARKGHLVTVYEETDEAGGFFRSARGAKGAPSEYSWHGFGPWYHNVYRTMQEIPFDETGSVYERALSRPIDFAIAGDSGRAEFFDGSNVKRLFRMTSRDTVAWAWLMLKTWTAGRRSTEQYASMSASDAFEPRLSDLGWRTWRAAFGPWVGSDWTNVSLHHVGLFFRKHLLSWPPHRHPADEDGPAWTQGSGTGWLLLRGPSSEVWFDRWVAYLERIGVRFRWRAPLHRLDLRDGRIAGATLSAGERVRADLYVLATNPFAAVEILARTPALEKLDPLRRFRSLVAGGPHTQVSFRIAFAEAIAWPRPRTAVVVADSEFNLTVFAEEQVWRADVGLGEGVGALWTGTACVATRPGRLFGLPLDHCTQEQFVAEVRAQLARCAALDTMVREANGGRSWKDFEILRVEVWHEWKFSPEGIHARQPKWVDTTRTEPFLPEQRTPVANLVLAGAHTRTEASVWSIEAAVESGRRAAQVVEPEVEVLHEYVPWVLKAFRAVDDLCYSVGLPHVLDLSLAAIPLVAGLALAVFAASRGRRPVSSKTNLVQRFRRMP